MVSVQVLPGPGIVARFGEVLMWLEEAEPGGTATTPQLLDVARYLADGENGRQAGGRVAEVLRSGSKAVPALVLVMPTDEGLQVVVHGWGRVLADGVDIDGGWADVELAWTTAMAAGRGGDFLRVPTPGSTRDLRRGSTPGGGAAFVLEPKGPGSSASSQTSITPGPLGPSGP